MTGLDVGTLDRRVTIEQLETEAASGFPVETWTEMTDVWMAKDDARGSERFKAAQVSASYESRWQLHYREDMDPNVIDVPKLRRLVYRGRTHDIVGAREIGRREGIELFTLAAPGR